ncbi:phage GP46 family protein [Cupriavidus gilardii]|uniref:Phage GP46 family protein n=1 Tax=Cupriavidus gilardii TaxID=82541 RepID=A0ABY4VM27_9BURK|nr:phage GP46 family protein [Cupriavidus gilardii]USE78056.1 phage GP46 family protein [Cupriavidus gilardii]
MDALLDPTTADYAGRQTDTLANAVYLRLATPLGSWWADPTLGSRLHELKREKDVARVAVLARQYAEQALRPLLNDGRATAITVQTSRPRSGWLLLQITVTQASGEDRHFAHPVRVI